MCPATDGIFSAESYFFDNVNCSNFSVLAVTIWNNIWLTKRCEYKKTSVAETLWSIRRQYYFIIIWKCKWLESQKLCLEAVLFLRLVTDDSGARLINYRELPDNRQQFLCFWKWLLQLFFPGWGNNLENCIVWSIENKDPYVKLQNLKSPLFCSCVSATKMNF